MPLSFKMTVVAGLSVVSACAAPTSADLVITDVTVYGGENEPPFHATIAVKDGAFAAIDTTGARRFIADTTVAGDGLYVTPGLWDMHAHIADVEQENIDVSRFPASGVTSIRDAGGFFSMIEATRAAIASGAIIGPNIYSVGPTLNGEQLAPFQRAVTTEDEVRRAIDELAASGAQMIKIHRAFKPELLPVAIDAAHEHGLKITGHIPLGVTPLKACELGMDGVEHLGSFLEAYIATAPKETATSAASFAYLESEEAAPLYQCLAARGVVVTPTLFVYPTVARARIGDAPFPPEYIEFMTAMERVTLRMHESGVILATGSDVASTGSLRILPGSSLIGELELLQESGIAAAEIIVMATSNPARALGVDGRTGSIAKGEDADFLLLRADPGQDVGNFRMLEAVYKGGILQPGASE